jgi:hypothetical protein
MEAKKSDALPCIYLQCRSIVYKEPILDLYVPDLNPETPVARVERNTWVFPERDPPISWEHLKVWYHILSRDLHEARYRHITPCDWGQEFYDKYDLTLPHNALPYSPDKAEEFFMYIADGIFAAFKDRRILHLRPEDHPETDGVWLGLLDSLKELIKHHKRL